MRLPSHVKMRDYRSFFLSAALICCMLYILSCTSNQRMNILTRHEPLSKPINFDQLAMLVLMFNSSTRWSLRADQNRYNYTRLHGYGMYVELGTMDPSRDAKYSKILALIHHMRRSHHQWFWMLDADAVVTNFSVKATDIIRDATAGNPDVEMIIGYDCNGFNSGSYFIKSSTWSIDFLQTSLRHITTKFKDQECLSREMDARNEPGLRVKRVPIATLQSYGVLGCGNAWDPLSHFVIHYPGNPKVESWFIEDIHLKLDWGYASMLQAQNLHSSANTLPGKQRD